MDDVLRMKEESEEQCQRTLSVCLQYTVHLGTVPFV